ncbi:MAG: class I SAM-dependent methyltransferase [Acidobacteria bacterium]|jgi:SAM-dependent methyltransferase|nr:class I SAM-dependent methyltransferase [Acidobacteriota bacterium]
MTEKQSVVNGWEEAYKSQALTGASSQDVPFLWQERPIPFLEDAHLLAELRRGNVTRVLDAGCGDARNSLALAREGYFVVGVDIAPTAINLAAERSVRTCHNRVVFSVDDISDLRVAGPFDLVVCADTLGQLADPSPAIASFHRVLRPGGLLLFNVYSTQDGTFGKGTPVDSMSFLYKDCLFKYFTEASVRMLVADWEDVEIKKSTWVDPPHGDFRPEPHVHDSFVVLARKGLNHARQ